VLNRYLCAAKQFHADAVVRITSDCPLIDPAIVDEVVREFCKNHADFGFNDVPNTFPRGLDVEVFTFEALQKADQLASQEYQREHVTPMLYERSDLFETVIVRSESNVARYRWTLDTQEDLELIRFVYGHFLGRDDFSWHEIVDLMERSPHLLAINSHVVQKQLEEDAVPFENALPAAPPHR
jgi:spore coat polysaccharide biosynthesis protein SpsF